MKTCRATLGLTLPQATPGLTLSQATHLSLSYLNYFFQQFTDFATKQIIVVQINKKHDFVRLSWSFQNHESDTCNFVHRSSSLSKM